METLYKNIKKLRKEKNISQEQLALLVGYTSRSSIAKIENGDVDLNQSKIMEFAKVFNVSPAYLMGWEDEPSDSKFIPTDLLSKEIMIPVLGNVPCGQAYEAVENVIDYVGISQATYNRGVRYALIADGDSMSPNIMNGDIMLIKPTPQVESGATAIVKVNGHDATCKKIKIGENTLTLIPHNNAYEAQVFTNENVNDEPVSIIGQVLEVRRLLD